MNRSPKVYINACNVHGGGGGVLLRSLLGAVCRLDSSVEFVIYVDSRFVFNCLIPPFVTLVPVPASLFNRIKVDFFLSRSSCEIDVLLCFGNLPPLFSNKSKVSLYLQNRFLIDNFSLNGFSNFTQLRLKIERIWLRWRISSVDEFIVQSFTMKKLLIPFLGDSSKVSIIPFVEDEFVPKFSTVLLYPKKHLSLVYVASGEPHKNHKNLILSMCFLAEEGVFPTLFITLDNSSFPNLCSWINNKVQSYGLKVFNKGSLDRIYINELYSSADALIYPSFIESFGLPLIEADQLGLPILASELDYVRDFVEPVQSFDPSSALSIARAIKRFMNIPEQSTPLQNADDFIKHLLNKLV